MSMISIPMYPCSFIKWHRLQSVTSYVRKWKMENDKWKMENPASSSTRDLPGPASQTEVCATLRDPSPGARLPVIHRIRGQDPWWQRHHQPLGQGGYVRLVHQSQFKQALLGLRLIAHVNSVLLQDPAQARELCRG